MGNDSTDWYYGAVCEHGHLARTCELCEMQSRIAELEGRIDRALAYYYDVTTDGHPDAYLWQMARILQGEEV